MSGLFDRLLDRCNGMETPVAAQIAPGFIPEMTVADAEPELAPDQLAPKDRVMRAVPPRPPEEPSLGALSVSMPQPLPERLRESENSAAPPEPRPLLPERAAENGVLATSAAMPPALREASEEARPASVAPAPHDRADLDLATGQPSATVPRRVAPPTPSPRRDDPPAAPSSHLRIATDPAVLVSRPGVAASPPQVAASPFRSAAAAAPRAPAAPVPSSAAPFALRGPTAALRDLARPTERAAPPPPPVTIRIDRIEINAPAPAPSPARPRGPVRRGPTLSLDAYLDPRKGPSR
ncbi:MAG: hypothetical protein EA339_15005 [Rhodobacteraceae bacterium]|nr:MAG: hypothetical protein EA339_15005 [Paracoccaceae bacterium]